MSEETSDPRIDRLYRLLPAIYRMRDAEQQYPLQSLLRVINEQVDVVEDDIAQLYEDWFIETAEDWAVPYIADLIGYRPVIEAGLAGNTATAEGREINRVLIPRREVANTIRYRRRKGTLALLEMLANDVSGWPARAVEFFKLLGWNQNLNHPHFDRARSTSLLRVRNLGLLDGPFDRLAHTVEVRRVNSHRRKGRYNIPSVGVFVWRLKSYSVTHTPGYCAESSGPHCHTFSVLGQDAPLFLKPEPETDPTHIAVEMNVPAPIRRRAFEEDMQDARARHEKAGSPFYETRLYGEHQSFAIWAGAWAGFDPDVPIPASAIIPADLTDWQYLPPLKHIAVDPVLGRFAFPPGQLPKKSVRVAYHYGFSADIGGGEYSRPITDPPARPVPDRTLALEIEKTGSQIATPSSMSDIEVGLNIVVDAGTQSEETVVVTKVDESGFVAFFASTHEAGATLDFTVRAKFYRVGAGYEFTRLREVLNRWEEEQPTDAVIELMESRVYVEPISVTMGPNQTLQIRAAQGKRAVMRLLDYQTDLPDALVVTMSRGSRFTLDGLLITGRPLQINGPDREEGDQPAPICGAEVVIRHCTLVPGWEIDSQCAPKRPAEPSLEFYNVRARARIEHSITGSLQIHENEVRVDPIPVSITDSIVDAMAPGKEAIGAPGYPGAHAVVTIKRSTVFGTVNVHAIELAENSIFNDCVNVARRQIGCMRFCYVPPKCLTPRRYRCQSDLVVQAVKEMVPPQTQNQMIEVEVLRVHPQFTSVRYGNPGYAQLEESCADEIKRGAEDESEMGVFHDLFQPQREANLRTRLGEYTPAGMDVGLFFAT
jgi:hypothetical protein